MEYSTLARYSERESQYQLQFIVIPRRPLLARNFLPLYKVFSQFHQSNNDKAGNLICNCSDVISSIKSDLTSLKCSADRVSSRLGKSTCLGGRENSEFKSAQLRLKLTLCHTTLVVESLSRYVESMLHFWVHAH